MEELYELVENACKAESNVFGYGIWTNHILSVIEFGKSLAPTFGADEEIVEIAALLHDYAGIKDHSFHKEHHIHGANEAEKLLQKYKLPLNKIELIKDSILNHRGSVQGKPGTPEAECLANSDAAAHISEVTSLLYLAFTEFKMDVDEGTEWVRKKLERSWRKISPQVKPMMLPHYECAKKILTKNSIKKIVEN